MSEKLYNPYTIILFYKYVAIALPEQLIADQREVCIKLGLTGRMIVAHEGINATLEGTAEHIEEYIQALREYAEFADVRIKTSPGTGVAFPKLSIKLRDEIVTSHFGSEVDPTQDTGTYLAPEELKKWYQEGKDFVVIDMRNDYEFISGHFKNSVHPGMRNFREIPEYLPHIEHLKEKTVVNVCTGGVRCEKASAYLKKQGFKDVYQLHDGMHAYMEKYPGEEFLGSLYVFDNRITMTTAPEEKKSVVGACHLCRGETEEYANCSNDDCHLHFLLCKTCQESDVYVFCSESCREYIKHNRDRLAKK